jgi:hypothetical protein
MTLEVNQYEYQEKVSAQIQIDVFGAGWQEHKQEEWHNIQKVAWE